MIERLKTLSLIQLKNKKNRKQLTKTNILIAVVVRVLAVVAVTGGLWFVLDFFKKAGLLPINQDLLLFILFVTQFISIITCVIGLVNTLYSSKDNSIIFSLPAKPTEIYISRLIVFYISEFMKNLYFLLPFLLSFGIILKLPFGYYLFVLINIFTLPLISVLIGAIVSLPIMYIGKLTKRFPIIKLILSLIVIGLAVWLLIYITNRIPRPLKLIAIYGQFFTWVKGVIAKVNSISTFYYNIVNLMLLQNVFVNLLIYLAILLGTILINIGLTIAYFDLASQSFEYAIKKTKKAENKVMKNTFATFIKKELLLNFRSVDKIINNFVFFVSMPVALYIINGILDAISTSGLGDSLVIAINILIGLLLLTASNTLSATALTSEGSEFALIKTVPQNTYSLLWAKFTINFVLSLITIVLTTIMLGVFTGIKTHLIIITFLVWLLVNTAHMIWSFQLDLLNPKFVEYGQTGSMHDNPNVSKSILIGIVTAIITAVLTFFVVNAYRDIELVKLVLIALAFLALRIYLFILNLKTYFKRIQP